MSIADVAIIGAGPYGLSIAAHLRDRGLDVRIFGRPMDTWRNHMPKGMCLKSEGFASNLYEPEGAFTLADFCRDADIAYADVGLPVSLETFCAYGLAFQQKYVGDLDERDVAALARAEEGFELVLNDDERFDARHVIVAVGISHYAYVPDALAALPSEVGTHSSRDHDYARYSGKEVAVVGAGASAVDVAVALFEAGASPQLVARTTKLAFHDPPVLQRSLPSKLRYPRTGIGCGLKSRFFADLPDVFFLLPRGVRARAVRTQIGPAPCWFTKATFGPNVPTHLGVSLDGCEARDGHVLLGLRERDGTRRELAVDSVIAATGYRVNLDRLQFLGAGLRDGIRVYDGAPILTRNFESSLPGLYFVGLSAANSFGPLLRFAYGARFAAERLRGHFSRNGSRRR